MQEEYCTLDPISRKLTLTEPQRIAGVESDEYAKGLKFKFPKTVDNIDLTQMQVRINFMNSRSEKGQYIVTDLKPVEGEEGYITFTWPFSRFVTHYRGLTKFVICAVKTDEDGTITAEWNTALTQLRVLEGLEVDESDIIPEEKDIIAQLIAICETTVAESAVSAQRAQAAAEKAAQGAQKSEAAATEADVSAQEAEISAVNSAASAQQAQTAAEQAAQEAQQSETSATESAASAQRAQEETKKVLDIIPVGGTKGQVLTKQSDADKDYNWQDPTGSGSSLREIANFVTEEDSVKINITQDTAGKPLNLRRVVGTVIVPKDEQATETNTSVWLFFGSRHPSRRTICTLAMVKTTPRTIRFDVTGLNGFAIGIAGTNNESVLPFSTDKIDGIPNVVFETKTAGNKFPVGTEVRMWGEDIE